MTSMILNTNAVLTMTSREIAELTGKEHKNVIRDIRTMLGDLEEDALSFERIYLDSMNREQTEYALDRELTETLLTGYSAVLRRKVIARWHELEAKLAEPVLALPLTPTAAACGIIENTLKVASLFGVPAHYAQAEAVKMAKASTGVDYAPLLTHSPAQDAIAANDLMLEPTELGKKYGLSAIATNKMLQGAGLQSRVNSDWAPTPLADGKCSVHHWTSRGKSGYNLKWKAATVAHLFGKAA